MKVCLVVSLYAPEFEGGTEIAVRAQARALVELGHDVRVVAGMNALVEDGQPERSETRVDGTTVVQLPRTREESHVLKLDRPRLLELCAREVSRADVVHVHHWWTLSSGLVQRLGETAPVVASLHDYFACCPRFFRSPIVDGVVCPEVAGMHEPCAECMAAEIRLPADVWAERTRRFEAELAEAALVLFPSEAHRSRVARLMELPERTEVVPLGLPRPLGAINPRKPSTRLFSGKRALRVLHFGHRSELKGTLDLVRALAALPRGSVELRLLGREVEPGFDDRLQKEAPGVPIQVSGAYDLDRLAEAAAWADLAAFPSRAQESYGLVVDEALGFGLPTWVSERGALSERLEGGGRVLPAEDPAAWTKAFRAVLDDPSTLRDEARAVPRVVPTAWRSAQRLTELYASVMRETT